MRKKKLRQKNKNTLWVKKYVKWKITTFYKLKDMHTYTLYKK